ncbi:unnamed protein product [Cyprideis torosa]|uniref:Heme NO-binding domain-containing protein n=1 Tax=Cyprideis torosa TaxID=163714 RepID=A0A7R8VZR2_9CRUS|nr:unnamed protein product [Cyprideis torosa]CAG0878895.1 unnamed protein product [Cyprideis torosa]
MSKISSTTSHTIIKPPLGEKGVDLEKRTGEKGSRSALSPRHSAGSSLCPLSLCSPHIKDMGARLLIIAEGFAEYVKQTYGEEKWEDIRRASQTNQPTFSIHAVYPETTIPKLCRASVKVLGINEKQFMEELGKSFVQFVGQYGYDRVLSVLGRHMRDFLNAVRK